MSGASIALRDSKRSRSYESGLLYAYPQKIRILIIDDDFLSPKQN
jgi:hypothetical protein